LLSESALSLKIFADCAGKKLKENASAEVSKVFLII
jgi:hypothetical protein